jgi:hypothetical protein
MEENTSKKNRHKIKITKKIYSKCTTLETLLLSLEFLKPIELKNLVKFDFMFSFKINCLAFV